MSSSSCSEAPRDPFPMTSPQAKELESTVSASSAVQQVSALNWKSMQTAANTALTKESTTTTDDSKQLLRSKKKKKTSSNATDAKDIYSEFDVQDVDAEAHDDFLDRPAWESRGNIWQRRVVRVMRGTESIYHRLYGDDLPVAEMLRTLCLASTLFFMIGGYWTLRSLKDPVLTALCGVKVIPKAKMLSVVVVLGVVSIYNAFLDSDIPRHRLFYIFGTFYFALFTMIAVLLMHPTIGLANEQPEPTRILGWISYCSIESFGSVMVSLFWSFANSNFSLKQAKASYGVMVATAQVGSILGPTIVNTLVEHIGVATCYMIGASCMLWLQMAMYTYISIYGAAERNSTAKKEQELKIPLLEEKGKDANTTTTTTTATGDQPKKQKPGILEGLQLFYKYNYVKGIFAISCLFMVEVTIVDFTMKVLARDFFAQEHPCLQGQSCWDYTEDADHGMSEQATSAFTKFMGFFGQATNTLSLIMSLFGTSAVIRYLGLRLTLLLFPSMCLAVICSVRVLPTLYVVFGAMIALKAASYSLNNPTKEILYQPTSPAVRYKAKSWIDIFGARGSKALGSIVTNAFSNNTAALVSNGSLVGMAVASFLIWNARFMGKLFDEYTAAGYIVGQDDDLDPAVVEAKNVNQASKQNQAEDTSCALHQVEDNDNDGDDDTDSARKPEVTMV